MTIRLGPEEHFMTALVVLALVWTFLAASTAFVIGHGIRLADTTRPARSGSDEMWSAADERQAFQPS